MRELYFAAVARKQNGESLSEEQLAQIFEQAQNRALAAHDFNPESLSRTPGRRVEKTSYTTERRGVGVISITGPIFRRANFFTMMSGATSTAMLAQDFNKALEDEDIRAILLDIDSPGGEAFGIGELADMFFDAAKRDVKPIQAYVGGLGASAAYYLASATQRIVVNKQALLGSIGVVMKAHKPDPRSDEIEIVSSQSPDKRVDASTEDGRAKIQTLVDDMAQVFVADVARYRGTTVKNVLENYGQGGMRVGKKAQVAGLADSVGTFEATLNSLAQGRKHFPVGAAATAADDTATPGMQDDDAATEPPAPDEEATNPEASEGLAQGEDEMRFFDKFRKDSKEVQTESSAAQDAEADLGQVNGSLALTQEALSERVDALTEEHAPAAFEFAEKMVLAGHVVPALSDTVAHDMLQAVIDDRLFPRASVSFVAESEDKTGTREEAVRARYAAMPKHTLAEERVAAVAEGEAAAVVLGDKVQTGTVVSINEERRRKLLSMTEDGRKALALEDAAKVASR